MTVREIVFRDIDAWADANLSYPMYYAQAESTPAYAMKTIVAGEEKGFLCEEQNGGGEYTFQFDFAADQRTGNWNQFLVEDELEALKNYVKLLDGQITVSGNTVRLYNARVSGIQPLGDPDGNFYGSFFELVVSWSTI